MRKLILSAAVVLATVGLAASVGHSAPEAKALFKVDAVPTIEGTLTAAKNAKERVMIHMRSGRNYEGIIMNVRSGFVHVGQLSGMEFFDAVISQADIEGVAVRVRDH